MLPVLNPKVMRGWEGGSGGGRSERERKVVRWVKEGRTQGGRVVLFIIILHHSIVFV